MYMKFKKYSLYLVFLLCLIACNNSETKEGKEDEEKANSDLPGTKSMLDSLGLKDLSNSTDLKELLCQTWDDEQDAQDPPMELGNGQDAFMSGYCFFKDGKMVKNHRGNFKIGEWEMDESKKPITITVKYSNGDREVLKIGMLSSKKMVLVDDSGPNKRIENYISNGYAYADLSNDPFSIQNNLWRIKPKKAESENEIKERVKGCVRFYTMFYDNQIATQSKVINFSGLPTCFKWYAGGIFMVKQDKLSPKWLNCFYNEKQMLEGYKMAEDLVTQKYTWPKGQSSWLVKNVAVLKQMLERL